MRHPANLLTGVFRVVAMAAAIIPAATFPAEAADGAPPAIVLSPVVPTAPVGETQQAFDTFSWQAFVALNWPALGNGQPDTSTTIGQPGAPNQGVWETWKESIEVFKSDGTPPTPWDAPRRDLPAACQGVAPAGTKVLTHAAKKPDVLFSSTQPFASGPLIDQNGAYARFEIAMNQSMFDYIDTNQLYNTQGQQAFSASGARVSFACAAAGASGAMMVKASWKILGAGDDPERFHATQALVWTQASANPPVAESCALQNTGLVGLHIATKLDNRPQWVWSTFEQVDNVPDKGQSQDQVPTNASHSFYGKACANCTDVNQPPPRPWNPSKPGMPTQIMRVTPIDAATSAINASWQAALAGVGATSPWRYYELIGTQWPTEASPNCQSVSPVDPLGTPTPQFLANATLESYIQGKTPNVSSSCVECHRNATGTNGKFSDYTYMLSMAKPLKTPP
jgi:hypothetical protein